jgi:hypothetical protein
MSSTSFSQSRHGDDDALNYIQSSPLSADEEAQLISRDYTEVRDRLSNPYESPSDCETPLECSPPAFTSIEEAEKQGAICDFIKTTKARTCLIKLTAFMCGQPSQGACLAFYDSNPGSPTLVRNEIIAPPTYYQDLYVDLIDIPNDGRKLVRIEHQGGHGTGVGERIHWIIGYKDGAFRTAFREHVYGHNDQHDDTSVYRVKYLIVQSPVFKIVAEHFYDRLHESPCHGDLHVKWTDVLTYDSKSCSFYSCQSSCDMVNFAKEMGLKVRVTLEQDRMIIRKMPPVPAQLWKDEEVSRYWSKARFEF